MFRTHLQAWSFSRPSNRPAGLLEKIGGMSVSVCLSSRPLSIASICLILDVVSSVARISSTSSFTSTSISSLMGWALGSFLVVRFWPWCSWLPSTLFTSALTFCFWLCLVCMASLSIAILCSVLTGSFWSVGIVWILLLLCGSEVGDGGCCGSSLLFAGGIPYFTGWRGVC